ncbi:hypothetical protein GQ42DRAFT_27569 [Ramicandelaber brevisporus]|nr:hypothetical protein GQ42DRAFT_27569 [Ramicandelaber brevisporus]
MILDQDDSSRVPGMAGLIATTQLAGMTREQYLARFHPLSHPYFGYAFDIGYDVSTAGSDLSIEQRMDALNYVEKAQMTIEPFSGAFAQVLDDHVCAVMDEASLVGVHPSLFYMYLMRSFAPNIIEELNTIRANSFEKAVIFLHQEHNPAVARRCLRDQVMGDRSRYRSRTFLMAAKLIRMDLKVINETNHSEINTLLEKWILSAPFGSLNVHPPFTNTMAALDTIEITLAKIVDYDSDLYQWTRLTLGQAIHSAEQKLRIQKAINKEKQSKKS